MSGNFKLSQSTVFAPACELISAKQVIAYNRIRAKEGFNNLVIPILKYTYPESFDENKSIEKNCASAKKEVKESFGINGKTTIVDVLSKAEKPKDSFLERANLKGLAIDKKDLSGSNLKGTDLSESKINNSNLSNTDLSGANLSNSSITNTNLDKTNLSEVYIGGTVIESSSFDSAILEDLQAAPYVRNSNPSETLNLKDCKLTNLSELTKQNYFYIEAENIDLTGLKLIDRGNNRDSLSRYKCVMDILSNVSRKGESKYLNIIIDNNTLSELWELYFTHNDRVNPIDYNELARNITTLNSFVENMAIDEILFNQSIYIINKVLTSDYVVSSCDKLLLLKNGMETALNTMSKYDESGYIFNYVKKLSKEDRIAVIKVFKFICQNLSQIFKMKNCAAILINTIKHKDSSKKSWDSILSELRLVSKTDLAGIKDFASEIFWKFTLPSAVYNAKHFKLFVENVEGLGVEKLERGSLVMVGDLLNKFSIMDIIGFSQRFHDFGFKDIRDAIADLAQNETDKNLKIWPPIINSKFVVNRHTFEPLSNIDDIIRLSSSLNQCITNSATLQEDCKRMSLAIFKVTHPDRTISTLGYKISIVKGRLNLEFKEHTGDQSNGFLNAAKDDPASVEARKSLEEHIHKKLNPEFIPEILERRKDHILGKIGIDSWDKTKINKLLEIIKSKFTTDSYSPYKSIIANQELQHLPELLFKIETLRNQLENSSNLSDEAFDEKYEERSNYTNDLVNLAKNIPNIITQNNQKNRDRNTRKRLLSLEF